MGRSFPGDKTIPGRCSLCVQGMARSWSPRWLLRKGSCGLAAKGLCFKVGDFALSCRDWGFNRGLVCCGF